jgi:AcrR family transcriptional regulator
MQLLLRYIAGVERDRTRVGEQRPGGRSARNRAAVLDAAIELLAEASYEQLSMENIAARAGVHKTTVYRRWPTKADLVADAIRARSQAAVPLPDTGSLHGDLRAFARAIANNIGSDMGGHMTRTLVAASVTSHEVQARTPAFWTERLAIAAEIIERAKTRDELHDSADANLIIETLIGPLYVRLLLTGEPIDTSLADRVAELVAAGAKTAAPLTTWHSSE